MVVTGCQRSGTLSMAKMFGLPHEMIFNPWRLTTEERVDDLQGLLFYKLNHCVDESSWMAAPFRKQLENLGPIVRVVRHPLMVARSLRCRKFWTDERHAAYRNVIKVYCPLDSEDDEDKSLEYWLKWNKQLDGLPTFRIEDVIDAARVNYSVWVGAEPASPSWDDFQDTDLKKEVMGYAETLGYE